MKHSLLSVLVLGGLALLTGCGKEQTFVQPLALGTDYYPVAMSRFWVYAVTDSSWSRASDGVPSVVTTNSYQVKEEVTGTFTDAARQSAYQLLRSHRASAAADWAIDSVFTINTSNQTVVLSRGNRRTVELIFPVRDGRLWNFNAYNNNTDDTITAETRRYSNLGQPYTTVVTPAQPAQTYPVTLTTNNEGTAKADDAYNQIGYAQVFAKGVGPVQRQRRNFLPFYINTASGVTFVPGSYFYGFSRTEVLADYGPR